MNTVTLSAEAINREYRLGATCMIDAMNHRLECGRLLIEMKTKLGHGNFTPWLENNCEFSPKTAQAMMRVAKGPLAEVLTEEEAEGVSRALWYHDKEAANDGEADERPRVTEQEEPEAEAVETTLEEAETSTEVVAKKKRSKKPESLSPTEQTEYNLAVWKKIAKLFCEQIKGREAISGRKMISAFGVELNHEYSQRLIAHCAEMASVRNFRKNTVNYVRLSDDTEWPIPKEFSQQLAAKFPAVDVGRALSDAACWAGMNPDKRWANEAAARIAIAEGMQTLSRGGTVWKDMETSSERKNAVSRVDEST